MSNSISKKISSLSFPPYSIDNPIEKFREEAKKLVSLVCVINVSPHFFATKASNYH